MAVLFDVLTVVLSDQPTQNNTTKVGHMYVTTLNAMMSEFNGTMVKDVKILGKISKAREVKLKSWDEWRLSNLN
mgnify:CR=1 FL=1